MKPADLVTAGLIGAAVYFLYCAWRDSQRAPRSYYAAPGTNDWWA